MRRAITAFGFVSILAAGAASLVVLPAATTRAAGMPERATYLIPASDGYGVADCLSGGQECGKVVADAWCEAHGYGRADAFGLSAAEDVTGTVEAAAPLDRKSRPISITCGG